MRPIVVWLLPRDERLLLADIVTPAIGNEKLKIADLFLKLVIYILIRMISL